MVKFLSYYTEKFKSLNRSVTPEGLAPHKPILLLTVITAIADHSIVENVFPKQALKPIFNRIWQNLVVSNHKCDLDSPYSAMLSEGFWHLHRRKSNENFRAAYIDEALFEYLQLENGRNVLTRTLLDTYFWNVKPQWGKEYPHLFPSEPIEKALPCVDSIRNESQARISMKSNMLVLASSLSIKSLPISNKCLVALDMAGVRFVADFCSFDLNKLQGVSGIGEKKIKELYKLQKIQRDVYKISSPIPVLNVASFSSYSTDSTSKSDRDMIETLSISQSCISALNNFHVKTIRDFCIFDLNALIGTPGIGKRKISSLHKLQQIQRDIYNISTALPELNFEGSNARITEPEPLIAELEHYSRTFIPFMSVPMRENMVQLDENKTIADLNLPDTLKRLFYGVGLYDFDELYLVGATCIEYLWRYLGNDSFQKLILHLSQCGLWQDKRYQITDKEIIKQKWENLFIAEGFFSDEEYSILQRQGIVSWGDYNMYITGLHCITSDFISICQLHFINASKINHFQTLLDDMEGASLVDMFFVACDSKSRKIYELRNFENKTLSDVASIVDLTSERVRQITKKLDENIIIQRPFTLPITSHVALFFYLEGYFKAKKGIVQQQILFEDLKKDFDFKDHFLPLMLQFCKQNFEVAIENGNIIFYKNTCLSCKIIRNEFSTILSSKDSLSFEEQVQISQRVCQKCRCKKCSENNWDIFLPVFYEKNFSETAFFDDDDRTLFTRKEYLMRNGSRRKVIDSILSPNKKLSFSEIFKELLSYRPDLTERQVYGYIQASDAVLADRGVYMLTSVLPSIPHDLLNKIEASIHQKLSANPNTLLSLTVVMKKYYEALQNIGCISPYMLFEILKRAKTSGIRYIKCPYVTSDKNTEKFSISNVLEDYIAEHGKTSLEKLREYICSSAGINEHVFTAAYTNSEKLLVDDDDCLLSIDDLEINRDVLSPIISKLQQLENSASITIRQLFDEHKVLCIKLNIPGPKLLFNILRLFESDNFIFRYPQISKSRDHFVSIRQQVIDFIKKTNSYCTANELNAFSAQNHLFGRYWYFPRTDYPELFKYLSGAWVHVDTLGYSTDWPEIVSKIAREVLAESTAPQNSYANLQEVCDKEDDLPILKNDLWWTSTLIAEILEESGDFLVYGKNKQFFSLKNTNLKINNFGDLCALLLEEDFGGAANLHEFSNYLRAKDLISTCDLHDSLLQGSSKIIIDHHEVYISEETVSC